MDVSKISSVLKYLENGGEIKIEGVTYVWLEDYPTKSINGVQYGVNGLAIRMWTVGGESNEPYYVSSDISLTGFINLVNKIEETDLLSIHASNVLMDLRKKR